MKRIYITVSLMILSFSSDTHRHNCPFNLCPFKGMAVYTPQDIETVGSDSETLDHVHFDHPRYTYDECENFLYTGKP